MLGGVVRKLCFNQYEFDSTDSEESLDAVISSDREHLDLVALLVEVGTTNASAESPHAEWPRWNEVVANLDRLAGLTVPAMSECQVLILSDSWDDLEVAFRFGSKLVWYHWWTTA